MVYIDEGLSKVDDVSNLEDYLQSGMISPTKNTKEIFQ